MRRSEAFHSRRPVATAIVAIAAALGTVCRAEAHEGPPYPIVSEQLAGPYRVSVWADPDTTDDGSAGGQFWVLLTPADRAVRLPANTRASVAIQPFDRASPALTAAAVCERGSPAQQFAALVIDHEGRFRVRVAVEGSLGRATLESAVDATYEARPAPRLMALYAMPFLLAGGLWIRLIAHRHTQRIATDAIMRRHVDHDARHGSSVRTTGAIMRGTAAKRSK